MKKRKKVTSVFTSDTGNKSFGRVCSSWRHVNEEVGWGEKLLVMHKILLTNLKKSNASSMNYVLKFAGRLNSPELFYPEKLC